MTRCSPKGSPCEGCAPAESNCDPSLPTEINAARNILAQLAARHAHMKQDRFCEICLRSGCKRRHRPCMMCALRSSRFINSVQEVALGRRGGHASKLRATAHASLGRLRRTFFCRSALRLPIAGTSDDKAFRRRAEDIVARFVWACEGVCFGARACQLADTRRGITTSGAAALRMAARAREAHGFAKNSRRTGAGSAAAYWRPSTLHVDLGAALSINSR